MKRSKITKGSIKKLLKKIFHIRDKNWFNDSNHTYKINTKETRKYFNSVKSTPLSEENEKIEEKAVINLIKIRAGMKILDLGCGEGRSARMLVSKKVKYVGVDFSKELISKARVINNGENIKFIVKPAQDYVSNEKFDLIFLFGLIPYMNDDDIRKLSRNCRIMLKKGGRLVLRDVILEDEKIKRKVFDDKNDFSRKMFFNRIPRYQLIRRSFDYELELFEEFTLAYQKKINGTKLCIKILK